VGQFLLSRSCTSAPHPLFPRRLWWLFVILDLHPFETWPSLQCPTSNQTDSSPLHQAQLGALQTFPDSILCAQSKKASNLDNMAASTQAIAPEVRQKFMHMREDIKKLTNTLQDIEAQQSEYTYVLFVVMYSSEQLCARKLSFGVATPSFGVSPLYCHQTTLLKFILLTYSLFQHCFGCY